MDAKKWPPPGFPIVEGDCALSESWAIRLPEKFARRIEGGSLVLWRPGLTIWLAAWNNDLGESRAERLAAVKEAASPVRFAERESTDENLTRYSYRLTDENEEGPLESVYGFVLCDDGQLQMAIYFDDLAEEAKARELVDNVVARRRP
jgi:hypothetical protein